MPVQSKERGYNKELLILPFDHRTSFQEKLFGIYGVPSADQAILISSYKTIVYDGFERAVRCGLPSAKMAILVDEQFGGEVIPRARKAGFIVCVAAEKSGQEEFDFEYGSSYGSHIEKVNPDFVKVLVRYNPEDDTAANKRQITRLAELSDYCGRTSRKYLFELLVPALKQQLDKCNGDKALYDVEMRPGLMVKAIDNLHKSGVEPDVWKLEGLDRMEDCERVCAAARKDGRASVGCIVLGRGENEEKVKQWLRVGAKVPGVIGFAVGRTVFWEPLKKFRAELCSREQAVEQIASNYVRLCKLWLELRA